ncbi:hypothetical protein ACFSJU_08290 [Paradesertivirga mongoliensis]|uniref:Uncharacterized protein n=1 Tax=Paradesertivirga mongoliensis TaxID=2100740 RepID=A0ABW4ZJY8_9SPHI|nr:hypothetical protein [Pedobacter mongoliensis]
MKLRKANATADVPEVLQSAGAAVLKDQIKRKPAFRNRSGRTTVSEEWFQQVYPKPGNSRSTG